jgi:hypothetical protein
MPTGARRSRAAPRGDGEYRKTLVGILRRTICSSRIFRRQNVRVQPGVLGESLDRLAT